MTELRRTESSAACSYRQTFAYLPIRFDSACRPPHAIVNYLYAILETEATIAAYRMGFDPALGLMHADKRYRPSLASDLMEPARPAADAIAVELLAGRELRRGEVFETRTGVCRLGPPLARELATFAPQLGKAVAPYAERLARLLLEAPEHPTPLTLRRHRAAVRAHRYRHFCFSRKARAPDRGAPASPHRPNQAPFGPQPQ